MALDNKLRVSELAQSGSRAIISEDPNSKTHTFIDGSTTYVSKSATEPYDHIEGERDGELTNYIEKPKYDEEQLKKAVDTEIDELILPPLPPDPEVVPKPVYDDLLERYNQAIADLGEANDRIRQLEAQVAQLQGQVQALQSQLDAARVAQAIAENQAQQTNIKYADLLAKFSTAIIKSTKEGIQRTSLNAQVEGLTAQKDTLREQIVQLRQLVASLQGQVQTQLDILEAQQAAAASQISGTQATQTAVAGGFQDMGDGDTYIKFSPDDSNFDGPISIATKCKSYSGPGRWYGGETLEIQNLKDADADGNAPSVTGVTVRVTSQSGGKWRGSKNWFKPSSQPNIARGERGSVTFVAEPWIHGQNLPQWRDTQQVEPSEDLHDKHWTGVTSREARTHTGNFELTIKYSDGATISKSYKWKLRKNKDSGP